MSIFDTDIRHPVEDLLTRARKVVCNNVRHALIHLDADSDYLVRKIGWDLEDEGLWVDRSKPEEDQIYKKIFGIKVKKEGYMSSLKSLEEYEMETPYYKVSLCWGQPAEFYNSDHIIPGYSIDMYVGINGIIHGDI